MKIEVIGDPEAVLGFSLVGLHGQVATSAAGANQALDAALTDPDVGIVLVTNEVAGSIEPRTGSIEVTQQCATGCENTRTGRRLCGPTFPE